MALIKDQITKITLDTMLGIRKGVGQARIDEFTDYVRALALAKEAGLDPSTLPWPMLMDRTAQGINAALSSTAKGGVEGGLEWQFINLTGEYSKETQQGVQVKVDMEFMSVGAPDLKRLQAMSVEELKKLLEVVEKDS
jgi:hypothetical protein